MARDSLKLVKIKKIESTLQSNKYIHRMKGLKKFGAVTKTGHFT